MDSIAQPEPDVKSRITATIRDWQHRRNVGVRSDRNAKRNAAYIVKQTAVGGWATDFVVSMVRAEGFTAVTTSEVQAVAQELAQAQAVAK